MAPSTVRVHIAQTWGPSTFPKSRGVPCMQQVHLVQYSPWHKQSQRMPGPVLPPGTSASISLLPFTPDASLLGKRISEGPGESGKRKPNAEVCDGTCPHNSPALTKKIHCKFLLKQAASRPGVYTPRQAILMKMVSLALHTPRFRKADWTNSLHQERLRNTLENKY